MSSPATPRLLRLGVLLSGNGTSLENLFERIDSGEVPARIAVVIASKEKAFGLERARRRGVPAIAVPRTQYPELKEFNDALHAALDPCDVDLVVMLGFLSPFELRGKYEGRTINVHPALIPSFSGAGYYGRRVHEAALEAGVKWSGATVHFADSEYDHGPIILQQPVPVQEDDTPETLAARVQAAERNIVPRAIRLFAEGRLVIEGRRVRIRPAGTGPTSKSG